MTIQKTKMIMMTPNALEGSHVAYRANETTRPAILSECLEGCDEVETAYSAESPKTTKTAHQPFRSSSRTMTYKGPPLPRVLERLADETAYDPSPIYQYDPSCKSASPVTTPYATHKPSPDHQQLLSIRDVAKIKRTANKKDISTPPWKKTRATTVESPALALAPDMKSLAGKMSRAAFPRVKIDTHVKPGTPVATR